jgi:hypothetical protein
MYAPDGDCPCWAEAPDIDVPLMPVITFIDQFGSATIGCPECEWSARVWTIETLKARWLTHLDTRHQENVA